MIRAQFDATRDEKDMRKLAAMLDEAEEKIFQSRHLQPNFYALDEGGICYSREMSNVDMQLDTLHPWEQVRSMIQYVQACTSTYINSRLDSHRQKLFDKLLIEFTDLVK